MFFYRVGVADAHLNRYAICLHNKWVSATTSLVSRISKTPIEIHKTFEAKSKEWVYFAINTSLSEGVHLKYKKNQSCPVLGFCCLSVIPRWKALETSMLYVHPDCRGLGLATKIYEAVLKDGVIIISGYSHNAKSRKLWMKLVQNPKYVSWAHDIKNLEEFGELYVNEEGNYECPLKLYEDIKKMKRRSCRQDIRIIIYKPRSYNE